MLVVDPDADARRLRGLQIRNAANRATAVYPGAVGRFLARELHAYAELSFLWGSGGSSMMTQVVEQILDAPRG